MKKVKVNQNLCISCSTCWSIDPSHFAPGATGKAMVKSNADDTDLAEEKVIEVTDTCQTAADSCPVGAIIIEEEEEE